jgi:hypothetical protein
MATTSTQAPLAQWNEASIEAHLVWAIELPPADERRNSECAGEDPHDLLAAPLAPVIDAFAWRGIAEVDLRAVALA